MNCASGILALCLIVFEVRSESPQKKLFFSMAFTMLLFVSLIHNGAIDPLSLGVGIVLGVTFWERLKSLKKPRNL